MSIQFNYPVINGVAVISLESPPVNSLSGALRVHLDHQSRDAVSRSEVQAVILIGANNVFCGGAEIREFNTPAQHVQPTIPELIEGLDGIDNCCRARWPSPNRCSRKDRVCVARAIKVS